MQHLNQYTQAPTLFLSSVTVRKMLRLTVFLQSYVPFHPRTKRDSAVMIYLDVFSCSDLEQDLECYVSEFCVWRLP